MGSGDGVWERKFEVSYKLAAKTRLKTRTGKKTRGGDRIHGCWPM